MPINRAPFNALVDDAGTGATGTPWNKQAIKDVLLDPIDAALPAAPILTLLTSTSGVATAVAGAANIAVIVLPVLGPRDTVSVWVHAVNASTAPVILDLRLIDGATDNLGIVLTGTTGAGDFGVSGVLTARVDLRPMSATGANLEALGWGAVTVGTGQIRGFPFAALNTANATSATNQLAFRQMSGITGGSVSWSWAVYLLKG